MEMRVTLVEGITGFGVSRRVFVAFRLGRFLVNIRVIRVRITRISKRLPIPGKTASARRFGARTASSSIPGRARPAVARVRGRTGGYEDPGGVGLVDGRHRGGRGGGGPAGAIAATAAANASAGTANFFAGAAGALRACSAESTARAGVARELISMRSSPVAATFRESPRVATAPGIARTATRPRKPRPGARWRARSRARRTSISAPRRGRRRRFARARRYRPFRCVDALSQRCAMRRIPRRIGSAKVVPRAYV